VQNKSYLKRRLAAPKSIVIAIIFLKLFIFLIQLPTIQPLIALAGFPFKNYLIQLARVPAVFGCPTSSNGNYISLSSKNIFKNSLLAEFFPETFSFTISRYSNCHSFYSL
jgi:hypothetical protein